MALALLGAVAVALAVSWGLSRAILGPIEAVTRGAKALGRGDLDQVVPVLARDELGELAGAFNAMARTLREFREAGTGRLLRAQKTAQATIDSFPDPVVVVDTDGVIERANPSARRIIHAYPSDESVPWAAPAPLKPALAEVLGGRDDYLPTGMEQTVAFRDDGQERHFLPRVLAIRDEEGGLLGAAVVLQDVTKFRLIDQLKSDMVSTVSHELKTPLTSLQMVVHLLLEEAVGPLTPKQVELLLAARQDSDRLLAMINDLLDLTRIEQGRVRLDLCPIAPDRLIHEALVRSEARAKDAGLALSGSDTSGLPAVLVDAERVEHVFDNLVGNAIRHTPKGGSIALGAVSEPGGGAVRFSVRDSGGGIAPENLGRVFEKFFRGKRGGAGLGLAIAREIVEAHGGDIRAESRPGEGATFTFTLPTGPAPAAGPVPSEGGHA